MRHLGLILVALLQVPAFAWAEDAPRAEQEGPRELPWLRPREQVLVPVQPQAKPLVTAVTERHAQVDATEGRHHAAGELSPKKAALA